MDLEISALIARALQSKETPPNILAVSCSGEGGGG